MKKSILLVSHSKEITDGLKVMIEQMANSDVVSIYSLGGTSDGELGSDPMKLIDAVNEAEDSDVYLVFADLGSAVMSSELAFDMLEENQQARYKLVDAPLVEGAFAAAITAGVTDDINQIITEAKNAGKKGWE
ncbi:dihydroxyacetone kinase phosphoryl donor subunit DhaM [Vagococcus zengguangii]|uniref:phosphoenolpyruvate--glycerone phosphotransferase n=1 Tax=Vagococcus zengguangii TaxID=2571750 RepID=A0A4D7CVK0_9ENTE|nr:dihydroxyacetone kinase phosphoryl donor subunit DhaM [Vagococcus zengguangii]QCI86301.1 PTS-dependent dihydroxyacetone kinase phosphotransferase subunit DhaM [Vagococcus zengguangii]TLG81428.1 PTS-dependent dihydroxyacetone kinase phosphotransferase subunit DhaM [Vagococcus zengguangii]